MSERELLLSMPSLSHHEPLGGVTGLGGCLAAWHWADGLATLLGCAVAVGVGGVIASRAERRELWIDGDDLCERTRPRTRRLPLGRVDDVRYSSAFNGRGTVWVVGGGISVDIDIDERTEPLRRGVGQRMRRAQSGRMYGDVRAMRSLFM